MFITLFPFSNKTVTRKQRAYVAFHARMKTASASNAFSERFFLVPFLILMHCRRTLGTLWVWFQATAIKHVVIVPLAEGLAFDR